mmetsp:Transcript_19031/g.53678  ORF Transcript_19031/g.53678 Transcript_19031/m.53678 type:complete len:206 (-) Transcript_19031:1294-1911(-)
MTWKRERQSALARAVSPSSKRCVRRTTRRVTERTWDWPRARWIHARSSATRCSKGTLWGTCRRTRSARAGSSGCPRSPPRTRCSAHRRKSWRMSAGACQVCGCGVVTPSGWRPVQTWSWLRVRPICSSSASKNMPRGKVPAAPAQLPLLLPPPLPSPLLQMRRAVCSVARDMYSARSCSLSGLPMPYSSSCDITLSSCESTVAWT